MFNVEREFCKALQYSSLENLQKPLYTCRFCVHVVCRLTYLTSASLWKCRNLTHFTQPQATTMPSLENDKSSGCQKCCVRSQRFYCCTALTLFTFLVAAENREWNLCAAIRMDKHDQSIVHHTIIHE